MSSKHARLFALAAVLLWLAAWFLPVLEDINGWAAFRYALASIWPYHERAGADADALPQILSAVSNAVFLVLAGQALLGRVSRPNLYARVALACALFDCYWFVMAVREAHVGDLRVGYYAWIAAFVLLIVSGASDRRTSRTPTDGMPA
jgi:hypothetical protein